MKRVEAFWCGALQDMMTSPKRERERSHAHTHQQHVGGRETPQLAGKIAQFYVGDSNE